MNENRRKKKHTENAKAAHPNDYKLKRKYNRMHVPCNHNPSILIANHQNS